jgi:two-component sensor histidine kinase/PAS domain-containing protein
LPIIYQSQLKGILYLENNLTSGAFTAERLEVLNLLSSQAAISLENAGLYQELRSYSQQLESKNAELITTNESLSAEITERKRVESERQQLLKQLEVERGLLEAVLRQMPAGVFIAEAPSGKIILANEQVEPIWRHAFLPCDNIEQYSQYNGFHPDGRQYSSPEWPLARSISTGEVVIGEEIKILRGDDTYGTIHVSSAPIRDRSNQIVAGVVTLYDITEKKRAENQLKASLKEKEVLLKEIHHRVKNNLQIISSLLYLQSRYIKDNQVLEIFKDSTNRVATMALIHEQLYQSKDLATIDLAEYIRNLVANLFASYEVNSEGIELKIKIDNVCLGIDTAVPCGLIINELVLNSLKYAFSEEKSGEICIEVQENDNKEFTLIVSDNGIGFPEELDFRNTKTLGCQLVMDLTEQLEGTIVLDKNLGTEFKITFPK